MPLPSSAAAPLDDPVKGSELFDARLIGIRYATSDVHLFEFALLNEHQDFPAYEAGAHVNLHLPNGMVRQYSLINPAASPKTLMLGIKRDDSGLGGSKYIFNTLKVSDIVKIGAPRNHFALDKAAKHTVLVAGGIGITPVFAMKDYLEAHGMSWELHYACRSQPHMPFLDVLSGDSRINLHFDDEAGQPLNIAQVTEKNWPDDTHFYCCGPKPMLDAFTAATAQFPSHQVHVEFFAAPDTAPLGEGFTLKLARSGRTLNVHNGQNILDALIENGIDVRYSCRGGVCGACETRVISGTPEHRDSILTEEERSANETVMICCAGSQTDLLVLDL